MNTRFVWPVCIAAAAHGALLFGFPKSARPSLPPVDVICGLPPFSLPPPEEENVVLLVREKSDTETPPRTTPSPRPFEPESSAIAPVRSVVITPPLIPNVSPGGWPAEITRSLPQPDADGTGTWRNGVDGIGSLDRVPRTRLQVAPLYPPEARRDGRSGTVTIEFMVDEAGNVVVPRVVGSSDRVFEAAAVRAVAKWRFEPGRRQGRIVRFRMAVPIHFNLNE